MKKLLSPLLIFILSLSLFAEKVDLPIKDVFKLKSPDGIEPSGIVFKNDTVYFVSDNGELCTYKEEIKCKLLKRWTDFEGITIDNEGLFYLVEEGKDRLVKLDSNFKVLEQIKVDRKFNKQTITSSSGNGFESLTFHRLEGNKKTFFTSNQSYEFTGNDKSSIIRFNDRGEILNYYPMNIKDIAGLHFYKNFLFALSDKEQTIFKLNSSMEIVKEYSIPYEDIEGIFIDGLKLYLAQDSGHIYIIDLLEEL